MDRIFSNVCLISKVPDPKKQFEEEITSGLSCATISERIILISRGNNVPPKSYKSSSETFIISPVGILEISELIILVLLVLIILVPGK